MADKIVIGPGGYQEDEADAGGGLYMARTNPSSGIPTALTSPAANLTASADTAFTFSATVYHWMVQNNSATPVNIEFDATATPGSYVLPPASGGQPATAWFDVPVTVVHLYSTAATAVNGTAASNVVLKGWS